MAQPSSAQREPSMEEILASIRRIIEDSDPARNEDASFGMGFGEDRQDGTAPHEAASQEGDDDLDAFREELSFAIEDATLAENDDTPPRSMIEIQAAIHKQPGAPGAQVHAHPAMEPPTAVEADVQEGPERAAAPMRTEPRLDLTPKDAVAAAPADALRIEDDEMTDSLAAASTAAREREPAAPSGAPGGELASIISEQAGRQIKASFGELSEVMEASRRRQMDDMAREMLRPMLQEWLDNNLPGLVEKLVREEIERVARGG